MHILTYSIAVWKRKLICYIIKSGSRGCISDESAAAIHVFGPVPKRRCGNDQNKQGKPGNTVSDG